MAMIQIRHVPDDVHRRLKARAAMEGKSLSDYLLEEVTRLAEEPTPGEMLARLRALPTTSFRESSAEVIRQAREERDARWDDPG